MRNILKKITSVAMRPLETTRIFLTLLYLHPADETKGDEKNLSCLAYSGALFVATLSFVVSSTIFFVKFVSVDLEESLYALFQICGFANTAYLITYAYFSHRRIVAILNELTIIYNTCKSSLSHFLFNFEVLKRKIDFFPPK